ncbi:3262_t:CDS:10 [Entrophospora sp. SA101]|nr:3262_t:CDS:10 [Entrophospora sp. SA101]
MTQYKVDLPPPAKRLVLFVGDGLRSDKLYQLYPIENDDHPVSTVMESKAPYLRNIILNEGVWGISHTRVPTESRPGHVAIIAGFYEDVSAVTKGWKTNPVEFDSAFNQSRHTWSFGSPDILPMFAEGASDPNRIDTFMYEHEDENFAQDIWVFNQFAQLLANSTSDPKLHKQLHENQIIIFLHLLGLDTNGHAHGPHSKEYINNIKLVDEGIKNVVKLIDNYYNHDGGTAYIFTADHGMSNRGNHGDGHPDNTRTPIIAWGAGINKPVKVEVKGEEKEEENLVLVKSDHDEFSYPWNLNHVKRYDVLQADLAPLMCSLIGINYPVNSVGELPLHYLDNTPLFKAKSIFVNAKQILEQYQVKYELKKKTEIMFKPFKPLKRLCKELIYLSLEGLRYLQTYDWLMLRSIVTGGFIGWILYSLKFTLKEYSYNDNNEIKLNYKYNLYVMLNDFKIFTSYFKSNDNNNNGTIVGYIVGYILVLEILVYSYFERSALSGCFILLSSWPLIISSEIKSKNKSLFIMWSISCIISSIFTLLPVEKGENILLVRIIDSDNKFMVQFQIAFFGTGNVASLSSFSLSSVYRLTTIFDPFLMGALLLLKILIPFFIVSSDYGSWLEIGTTISHFVISNLFSLFMIILFGLSEILVGKVRIDHSDVDDIVDDLVDLASRRKKDK